MFHSSDRRPCYCWGSLLLTPQSEICKGGGSFKKHHILFHYRKSPSQRQVCAVLGVLVVHGIAWAPRKEGNFREVDNLWWICCNVKPQVNKRWFIGPQTHRKNTTFGMMKLYFMSKTEVLYQTRCWIYSFASPLHGPYNKYVSNLYS